MPDIGLWHQCVNSLTVPLIIGKRIKKSIARLIKANLIFQAATEGILL